MRLLPYLALSLALFVLWAQAEPLPKSGERKGKKGKSSGEVSSKGSSGEAASGGGGGGKGGKFCLKYSVVLKNLFLIWKLKEMNFVGIYLKINNFQYLKVSFMANYSWKVQDNVTLHCTIPN